MAEDLPLDDRQIDDFAREGVTVIRALFAPWIGLLREGVAINEREPGPYMRHYTAPGMPGHFFGDYCNWQRIAPYRTFVCESPAAHVAARLMGSRRARFFHEHVLVKEPGSTEPTPWHHDQPYYGVDGIKNCSLWIPLDPVPEDTCIEFVAGSHRWGRQFLPRMFSGEDYIRRDDHHEEGSDSDQSPAPAAIASPVAVRRQPPAHRSRRAGGCPAAW